MFKKVAPSATPPDIREKIAPILNKLPPHYPVLTAEALLRGKQFPSILTQIKSLAFVPDDVFSALYEKSIYNYAEFVQGLPASQVDNFNYHGGLLELGIRRGLQTLAWYRREYPVRQHTPDTLPARQAIWSYALFTAGLLYGVGHILATYWIMICDKSGHTDKLWNPVAGKMALQGDYYRCTFETTRRDEFAARSTLVLAQIILPPEGISWIATDKEIFNGWLAILLNDEKYSGLFAKCVFPIDADLKQLPNEEAGFILGEHIEQYDIVETPEKDDDLQKETNTTPTWEANSDPKHTITPGIFNPNKEFSDADLGLSAGSPQIGVAILLWLRNGMRNHSISPMRDMLIAAEGTFIGQDLIARFAAENKHFGSAQDVFNKLKESSFVIGQAYQQGLATTGLVALAQNEKRQNGVVFDTSIIFGKKIPNGGINYDQKLVVVGVSSYPLLLANIESANFTPKSGK